MTCFTTGEISSNQIQGSNVRKKNKKSEERKSKHKMSTRKILQGAFQYDDTDKSRVKCTYCDKTFKYHHSTSSLKYHLQNSHPTHFRAYKKKVDAVERGQSCDLSTPTASSAAGSQQTLADIGFSKVTAAKAASITEAMTVWIAKSCRPISISEDDGLKKLLQTATGSSQYTPPSRTTIQRRVDQLFSELRSDIQKQVDECCSVALTCDYWTSLSNTSFLGMTGHFVDPTFELKSFVLGCDESTERHTATNVKDHITHIIEDYKLGNKVNICM